MKAVIYARYSSDQQREASIEDQIRVCKTFAEREGWHITNIYTDYAMSGSSMMRPGIQMVLQDAAGGKFDVLLAEDLDRISRDQEDIAAIFKRLNFAEARIHTLSDGLVTDLHIGLKGTMSARYLKDLAQKTHRGLRGRVENGKSGGGLCYGYDVVRKFDAKGMPENGDREINQEQAAIVRRIFDMYNEGISPKAIAVKLNQEKIPGPTGNEWGASTIHGNRQRGTGILNNELYIGRLVWNRLRYLKDPETGKRISRLNDEAEWVIHDVPDLRIVDQNVWDATKAKQGEINSPKKKFYEKQRPKNLFSFLLKCGECEGGYSMLNQTHLGCSTSRNKGTCENRLTIKRERLEETVLGALRGHLMDPELSEIFCEEYTKHINELRMEHNASLNWHINELDRAEKELDKLIDAICDGVPASRVKDRMHILEERRTELKIIIEDAEEAPTLLHPAMSNHYHKEIRALIDSLNSPDHRTEAATIIRSLVDKVVLTPNEERTELHVDLIGDLAGILCLATDSWSHSKGKEPNMREFAEKIENQAKMSLIT